MKKIAVFGASGGTGKQVVKQALDMGLEVHAFTRSSSKISEEENMKVFEGDVLNSLDVEYCISGCDGVIVALGGGINGNMIRSQATEVIINAMYAAEIERIIVMSTFGAHESLNMMPEPNRAIFTMFLGQAVKDHERQEDIVRNTQLDYTIVRPSRLTNGPLTGKYRVGENPGENIESSISRADVAQFMLIEFEEDNFSRKAVIITN